MAYSKRVPPIKLVLSRKEYNTMIGVLNDNIENGNEENSIKIANLTKEKLLKFSIPIDNDINDIEIEARLYINEAIDFISQLLLYASKKNPEVDYYQVLLKVRENVEKNNK